MSLTPSEDKTLRIIKRINARSRRSSGIISSRAVSSVSFDGGEGRDDYDEEDPPLVTFVGVRSSSRVAYHGETSPTLSFPDLGQPNWETVPGDDPTTAGGEYSLSNLAMHSESHLLIGERTSPNDQAKAVFKYQMNCVAKYWESECAKEPTLSECVAEQNPDPLVNEYAILTAVYSGTKLAPIPYALSGQVKLTERALGIREGKTRFNLIQEKTFSARECVDFNASVRVLVQELVGPSVAEFLAPYTTGKRSK